MDLRPSIAPPTRLRAAADFQLHELTAASGLRAQLLPSGALFALRHRETLINQLLPGPAEDGLFRLIVRWLDAAGRPQASAPLVGPQVAFAANGSCATWRATPPGRSVEIATTLALHPRLAGWAWRIRLHNTGTQPQRIDLLHAQDLGVADEGAVRNNEAYVSQYIDLLPLCDPSLGPVILARQNQPMAGGRRPWLALGCVPRAVAYCTDGTQFFGLDHRLTAEPDAVRSAQLPSHRLQYEFALGGLQSDAIVLAAGATTEIVFVARYLEDHPAASSEADLARLHEMLPASWLPPDAPARAEIAKSAASVFVDSSWLHGEIPTSADWTAWFPGDRRHEERDAENRLLSFFCGDRTHVVSREKESALPRPHGHILRSGSAMWIDDDQFGVTCYASGIFGAQSYLGNPSLARLLSVVRNQLNLSRASGQRVFLRRNGSWHQLGVPSAFVLEPGIIRWIYRLADRLIEIRVWCSASLPASYLEINVTEGPPSEFLLTHQLALGAVEFENPGELEIHSDAWIGCWPVAESFMAKHLPRTCFALAGVDPDHFAAHGGDELLYTDGTSQRGPYAAFVSKPVHRCALLMLGAADGKTALPKAVAQARAEYAACIDPAQPPTAPVRLQGSKSPATSRIDEVLPWFTHNAAIHFSAPHGLEQYGGAAWGVRDVCQGSVEWLLAAGEFATVRRILTTVFEQQYAHGENGTIAGGWPQWFMFPPFRFIQQAHSHGDVCFWPVKALCDYVEASNDFEFLSTTLGYTDPEKFMSDGPIENLWAHCDRVVAQCEARFVPGTALVNYGDGDWDDTLQPADPAMRTRMVSSWTVGLAFHTLRQLADISRRGNQDARADHLDELLAKIRRDFAALAMPDGIVAGFMISEPEGGFRPILHPTDKITGIRYRLLPMTRSILAELFTAEEAKRHLEVIERELRYPDGVRLMSEPAAYQGGLERLFKRADTAANVGREIGLQYVHAHLRFAEALAKVGDADRLWTALQVVNPVALSHSVPNAAPRQSNVYFSSSDADFDDRYEAMKHWSLLKSGEVAVRGGWRLYSSGPGLFLHKVRCCLLGVRESFNDIIFDPVLPPELDGLSAEIKLCGRVVALSFRVLEARHSPEFIEVNGQRLEGRLVANPYRKGGLAIPTAQLVACLTSGPNRIEIRL